MKFEKFKEDAYKFSEKASELTRQFAFAGIAVIWIFKIQNAETNIALSIYELIPQKLLWPLFFMVITLTLDLLQNYISYIIWSTFYRTHEKKGVSGDKEIKANPKFSLPSKILFHSKIVSLMIGYGLLINFIIIKM